MSKFQLNQKVRCIGMHPSYSNKLIIGNIYTVAENPWADGPRWISVEENERINCYEEQWFEPVDGIYSDIPDQYESVTNKII